MKVTNPSFLTLLSGVILATAGLAIASSAPAQAETFSIHPEQKISTEQPLDTELLKDDDKDDDDDDKAPASIKRSILEKISEQTGTEVANLRIVKLESKTWSDGCLGLGQADNGCMETIVPGWLAVVAHNNQRMVYRTDAIGSVVMLDKTATAMVNRTVTETRTSQTTTQTRRSITTVNTSTQAQAQTYSTTAQMQNSYTGFTLGIWQPSGKLANVIARVSLKEKTDSGYAGEKLLGDYKYKINKKAKFKKVKPGDRVVVRLYDLKNSLIGYSQFEVLSQYTAVNLILSSQPTQYRVVRTICGVDADDNGAIDSDTESYSYYTQVTGAAGQRRVTFLSEASEIKVSQFQVSGFSSATTIAYPASFTSGEYTLSSQTMDVFSSDLDTTLISLPGTVRQIVAINANNSSTYDVSMLSTQYTTASTTTTTAFSDVASNYWANKFIVALAEKKIIEGYPDGLYRPERPVTRAEFATMLSKAFQMTSKTREAIAFTDVSSDFWAYEYIQQAYEMGFLSAFSGKEFNPKLNLTRLDILMALVKGLNYSSTTSTTRFVSMYSDVTTMSKDMRTVLAAATARGIVVNYPDVKKFKAKKVATRAEVAAFIYQAMVSNGQVSNIDSPYVVGDKVKVRGTSNKKDKVHCNQGIGNGAEGCDPGNSRPHGGSNDEGGRTPGGKNR